MLIKDDKKLNDKKTGISRVLFIVFYSIVLFSIGYSTAGFVEFLKLKSQNSGSKNYEIVKCDAERLSKNGNKFLPPERFTKLTFGGAVSQTDEIAFSGEYAVKTDKNVPFGLSYEISNATANEHFKISVWRFSRIKKGVLVISTENPGKLYIQTDQIIDARSDGWEKLQLDLIVPQNIIDETLKIYVWNPDTSSVTFFDDMEIMFFKN